MPKYRITTTQEFFVTYDVEANSPQEAWDALWNGAGDCTEQIPNIITGTKTDADIEQIGTA